MHTTNVADIRHKKLLINSKYFIVFNDVSRVCFVFRNISKIAPMCQGNL